VKKIFQLQITLVLLLAVVLITAGCSEKQGVQQNTQPIQSITAPNSCSVYFSPNGGATDAVIDFLSKAQKTVRVQAYSFTSAPIARALVDAHKRGVAVKVILDKSNKTAKYSSADFLIHAGIPTYIDSDHAIAHNKIMIIDDETVLTGSFNFTKAAEERNAENLLVINDKKLAGIYTENWQEHFEHSERYEGKGIR
jgi:phosphatidylserine/phosphatidylglycerophosphate/cardiolipin synthase-like enzyme